LAHLRCCNICWVVLLFHLSLICVTQITPISHLHNTHITSTSPTSLLHHITSTSHAHHIHITSSYLHHIYHNFITCTSPTSHLHHTHITSRSHQDHMDITSISHLHHIYTTPPTQASPSCTITSDAKSQGNLITSKRALLVTCAQETSYHSHWLQTWTAKCTKQGPTKIPQSVAKCSNTTST
jgi:hypothetical protein